MSHHQPSHVQDVAGRTILNRRAFMQGTTLFLAGAATGCAGLQSTSGGGGASGGKPVRIGLITDIHYADKTRANTRYYRDSLDKMQQAVAYFNEAKPDFVVELGDLVDSAGGSVEKEIEYLDAIEAEFAKATSPRHYVLGNHCVDILTKDEFLAHTAATAPHYSFDKHGYHFVILDACYREDGVSYGRSNANWRDTIVPAHELQWLETDLAATNKPIIVFAHQRLDDTTHHSVKNRAEVRAILEAGGKVIAVFQGHSHANEYVMVNGIHYCVVRAMVEGEGMGNNAYGMLTILPGVSMKLDGFVQQKNYNWPAATREPANGATNDAANDPLA